ncbi:MAG TPA: hypothetical protein VFO66_08420 [Gemmatimonadaceae bacterium]|nr:hypothetical protein [Gemmatimonadaceae bacterium]
MRLSTLALLRTALAVVLVPAPLGAQAGQQALDSIDVPRLTQAILAYADLTVWRTEHHPDPLEFVRRHAKFPVAPPGAAYERQCSADVRTAVFSLGRGGYDRARAAAAMKRFEGSPASAETIALGSNAMDRLFAGDTGALKDLMEGTMAAGTLLGAALGSPFPDDPLTKRFRDAIAWYHANGYVDDGQSLPVKKREAADDITVTAVLLELPMRITESPLCRHLMERPVIEVDVASSASDTEARNLADLRLVEALAFDTLAAPEHAFRAQLEELGLDDGAFTRQLRSAMDARYAAGLPALPTVSHPLLPGPEYLARHAAWYRTHAASLEPAMTRLWSAFARPAGPRRAQGGGPAAAAGAAP